MSSSSQPCHCQRAEFPKEVGAPEKAAPRAVRRALAAAVFVAVGGSLAGCHRAKADIAPLPPPAVVAFTVTSSPAPALSRRGRATTGSRLRLGFAVPGELAEVLVDVGQHVKAGQTLARLNTHDLLANQRATRAARTRAAAEHKAAENLSASGSLAPLDQVRMSSFLEVARANEALATKALAHARLVAPVDGTVFERRGQAGEVVSAGAPVIVLDEAMRIVVRAGIPERELERVQVGEPVTLAADERPPVRGVVGSIAPSPDTQDGLYGVELTPDANSGLRPGSLVNVTFLEAHQESHPRVPMDALAFRQGKPIVFVIDGAPSARVHVREVAVDPVEAGYVLVRSGLKAGERVVREGAQFLLDNQTVTVLPQS